MNRNQKIAVGCGAAGCLVLIVVVIVGCIAFFAMRSSGVGANRNLGSGINRGSARNANASSDENSNSNPQSAASEESSSSSMSNDARHKLWQAAGATQDTELMQRVMRKLNLLKEDGSTTDEYATFLKDHIAWALKNVEFMQSINTIEKARAYVEAHIND